MDIKTIDVNAKSWFDKVNGNSYFSAVIIINYGMPDQKELLVPFQYGYGNQYEWEAKRVLQEKGYFPESTSPLYSVCKDRNIIFRSSKQENCKKREVIAWGE